MKPTVARDHAIMKRPIFLLFCAALFCVPLAVAGDAPDGTTFSHQVIAVDGPDLVRIRFCGVPMQVRLANVKLKGPQADAECAKYLKDVLKSGTVVRIELEPELDGEAAPCPAQMFVGTTHVNAEIVKRGLAVSDGRSRKFGGVIQAAQLDAMTRKLGVWAEAEKTPPVVAAAKPVTAPPEARQAAPAAAATQAVIDTAPLGYSGPVVADLSSKEYHFPASRYARNIRPGARIEYKSPDEAERAGKTASPFSFPDRAKTIAAATDKGGTGAAAAGSPAKVVEAARKAMEEALSYMQEARRVSRTNNAAANENWKKAAKLLTEHLDRVIPVADADPNNRDIQKLTEDMSMNLYSCKKYQSL
jgi:hypothetical protein